MRLPVFLAGLLTAALLAASSVVAQLPCREPPDTPPRCTDQSFGRTFFENEWRARSCRNEVRRYLDDLERWVRCVRDDANRRMDAAVEQFNCKAEGRKFC